jgi:hypothetical protein
MSGMTSRLSEYPFDWVELACRRCQRRGRLRKAGLIEMYGSDVLLAELRLRLATGCGRLGSVNDPCGLHYVGLNEGANPPLKLT